MAKTVTLKSDPASDITSVTVFGEHQFTVENGVIKDVPVAYVDELKALGFSEQKEVDSPIVLPADKFQANKQDNATSGS